MRRFCRSISGNSYRFDLRGGRYKMVFGGGKEKFGTKAKEIKN